MRNFISCIFLVVYIQQDVILQNNYFVLTLKNGLL